MSEEILRVLKMVEEGKIDSKKASEIIETLKREEEVKVAPKDDERMLKIKVNSSDGDNVNVNVPVKFIKAVIKSTGKLPLNLKGNNMDIDTQALLELMDSGTIGKIVDIKEADGDNVEIVIE